MIFMNRSLICRAFSEFLRQHNIRVMLEGGDDIWLFSIAGQRELPWGSGENSDEAFEDLAISLRGWFVIATISESERRIVVVPDFTKITPQQSECAIAA